MEGTEQSKQFHHSAGSVGTKREVEKSHGNRDKKRQASQISHHDSQVTTQITT